MGCIRQQLCAGQIHQPNYQHYDDGAATVAAEAGVERPTERWNALCEWFESTFPKPMVFVDAHGGLPYAATGNDEGQAQFQQLSGNGGQGPIACRRYRYSTKHRVRRFAKGQWSKTISSLEPIMDDVVCIGGSRAQRDLVTNTLLAYINDGQVTALKRCWIRTIASHQDRSCP